MDQPPTRAEFDQLAGRVTRNEQRTEEIKAIRIEVASADVLNQLQVIAQKQDKISTDVDELKLDAKAYVGDAAIFKNKVEHIEDDVSTLKDDVGTLKTDMTQVKTDIDTVKTRLDGHVKYFEEHGRRLSQMATKEDLSTLEAHMATKDDIRRIEATQEQILKLLQQKG